MLDGTESARTRPIDGAAIGWRVHELIGRPGAMQRFREVLLAWVDDRDQQHRVHDEWEQRREEHFRSSVARKKKRLLDEVAGPPGDGWRFEGRSLYREPRKGRRKWRGVFGVWCPPDLAADAEPPVDDPLSFCDCSDWPDPGGEPNRPLSLKEKYVVCAAFHDAFCLGADEINPWEKLPDAQESWAYMAVCGRVKDLHEADRPAVESFLADVAKDLEAACPPNSTKNVKKRRRGGQEKHNAADDRKLIKNWRASELTKAEFEQKCKIPTGSVQKAQWRENSRNNVLKHD